MTRAKQLSPPKLATAFRTFRSAKASGKIICADAHDFLTSLEPGSADIVFLDPPFNLNKIYTSDRPGLDSMSPDDYSAWLLRILAASARVLSPGGTLYMYHLPIWAMRSGQALEAELQFQHWIAISMKNGFVRGPKLYPAHYALLMFTKGVPRNLRRPRLRPKLCRHCGGLVKDYGGYRQIIESKGINLSDVWEDLSPVRHANKKYRSANELPRELFSRVFEVSGVPQGLYVDPFAGSGTGAIMASNSGMRFMVCDLLKENCEIIADRLDEMVNLRS